MTCQSAAASASVLYYVGAGRQWRHFLWGRICLLLSPFLPLLSVFTRRKAEGRENKELTEMNMLYESKPLEMLLWVSYFLSEKGRLGQNFP